MLDCQLYLVQTEAPITIVHDPEPAEGDIQMEV